MRLRLVLTLLASIGLALPTLQTRPVLADDQLCSQPGVHLISTIGQLESIGSPAMPLDGTYCLTQDLDAKGATYPPISEVPPFGSAIPFEGTLDGQGHVIKNLRIVGTDAVGLFGVSAGTIQDLGLVREAVSSGSGPAGGMVGFNAGHVKRSFVIGSVTGGPPIYAGQYGVGGLVGENWGEASVCDSYSGGSVTGGPGSYIGGLVGEDHGAINSYSAAAVSGAAGTYVGGLTGDVDYDSASYSLGPVSGDGAAWEGGLTGTPGSDVQSSTWDTTTSGLSRKYGGFGPTPSGLNDVQMRIQSNFTELGGWYFAGWPDPDATHWVMINGITYPFLIWQVTIPNLAANTYGYATTTALADKLDALLTRAEAAQAAHDTGSMDSLLRSYVKLVSSMSGRSFTPLDDRLLVMEAALILAGDSGLPCCDYPPC